MELLNNKMLGKTNQELPPVSEGFSGDEQSLSGFCGIEEARSLWFRAAGSRFGGTAAAVLGS